MMRAGTTQNVTATAMEQNIKNKGAPDMKSSAPR